MPKTILWLWGSVAVLTIATALLIALAYAGVSVFYILLIAYVL